MIFYFLLISLFHDAFLIYLSEFFIHFFINVMISFLNSLNSLMNFHAFIYFFKSLKLTSSRYLVSCEHFIDVELLFIFKGDSVFIIFHCRFIEESMNLMNYLACFYAFFIDT